LELEAIAFEDEGEGFTPDACPVDTVKMKSVVIFLLALAEGMPYFSVRP
jgi:hypothetical protein